MRSDAEQPDEGRGAVPALSAAAGKFCVLQGVALMIDIAILEKLNAPVREMRLENLREVL